MPLTVCSLSSKSPIATVTDEQFKILVDKAVEAKAKAYCPYSNFHVGCAILTEDDQYVVGANVENASFGGAICAERTAIVKAVTAGHLKFKALSVCTDSIKCGSPCGICRQVIREFSGPDLNLPVVMLDKTAKHYILMTMDELLPASFGPEDLLGAKPAEEAA